MNFRKKLQHNFPKMRGGGQRPFGTFPFWKGNASLITFSQNKSILYSFSLDLCGWLPSCLYTCAVMIFCFSMNLSLPAPPVRGKRQGLWGDNAASQALPIHHKSPGERMGNHGKSPLYGFTQSSSYSIKWWGWCAALTAIGSPASGPRSWETDLGPFQPLEPDSQECFLMCELLISSDTAFSATEKGILCNWDFSSTIYLVW